jgi:hypothetical protein
MKAAARGGHSLRRATIPDRDLDGRESKNERGTKSAAALRCLKEPRRFGLQCDRELRDQTDRRVPDAALDPGDVGPVALRLEGEALLGEPDALTVTWTGEADQLGTRSSILTP